jgi:hypothetical protein
MEHGRGQRSLALTDIEGGRLIPRFSKVASLGEVRIVARVIVADHGEDRAHKPDQSALEPAHTVSLLRRLHSAIGSTFCTVMQKWSVIVLTYRGEQSRCVASEVGQSIVSKDFLTSSFQRT